MYIQYNYINLYIEIYCYTSIIYIYQMNKHMLNWVNINPVVIYYMLYMLNSNNRILFIQLCSLNFTLIPDNNSDLQTQINECEHFMK